MASSPQSNPWCKPSASSIIILFPFNTSAFSNTLGDPDCAAQCKALVTPFDEFGRKPTETQKMRINILHNLHSIV
jgi:hypothetical protein